MQNTGVDRDNMGGEKQSGKLGRIKNVITGHDTFRASIRNAGNW